MDKFSDEQLGNRLSNPNTFILAAENEQCEIMNNVIAHRQNGKSKV